MTTRCQTTSRNQHLLRLLLAAVTLAIASATLPASAQTGAQTAAPQATTQLRRVPTAPRQPNYVMLDNRSEADSEAGTESAASNEASQVHFKLHGHWVIDILNSDHSIAQHHAFENSLAPGDGQDLIFGLLSGYYAAGSPAIVFGNNTANNGSPCTPANYQAGENLCGIVVSTSTEPGLGICFNSQITYCAATLTRTFTLSTYTGIYNGNQLIPATLVLAGSITANQVGTINFVSTEWSYFQTGDINYQAASNTSPASCQAQTSYTGIRGLSGTTPNTISVASGQIIQVTITFTIS